MQGEARLLRRGHAAGLLAGIVVVATQVAAQSVEGEYYYLLRRTSGSGINAELRGVSSGGFQVALAPNADYELWVLERGPLKRLGSVVFKTGPDGSRQEIPAVRLRTPVPGHDEDGDGLSDQAEAIIGSDPRNVDSDGDGQNDLAEFLAGTTLTEVTTARTGLIGSVATPGEAQDVQVNDELCVVASGSAGVVCLNVFNTLPAAIVARVDTPGDAKRVAIGDALVGVADGPGGFHVVDVSDPPAARISLTVAPAMLGGNAECVAVAARVAYVGLSTGLLVTVDMSTGNLIDRVPVSSAALRDVCLGGDAVYATDGTTLFALTIYPGDVLVTGSAASPVFSSPATRVSAAGGFAYVTHGKGVNTFSLADPAHPVLLAETNTAQFGWKQWVVDGSGRALAATGPNEAFDGPHDVGLFDASDPAQTNSRLTTFTTPGIARSVALYNGLCYCADQGAGLQVIAYQAADRNGIAPTVSLSTNYAPITAAEEGQLLRITAAAADDVAVRNCELWVNGVRQSTDGSFPFEFYLVTPTRDVRPSISVRVRVSDLGGNFVWSDELVIELFPDQRPPQLVRVVPAPGGLLGQAAGVAAFLNEVVDPASVTASSFTLREAGPDRVLGTSDDLPVAGSYEVRPEVLGVFLNVSSGLAPGRYRAQLTSAITDRAGNALPAFSWDFLVYGSGSGADADNDGIPDELELFLGLDPGNPDSNGNGIPDGDEDLDGDSVSNRNELILGFDLTSADSDGDGIPDAQEDRDFDLLPDVQELALGTSIFAIDTDGDGFPESDEVLGGSDPLDPASIPLRQAGVRACVLNQVDPAHALGRASVPFSAQNLAAPESGAGASTSPPTSVRNQ